MDRHESAFLNTVVTVIILGLTPAPGQSSFWVFKMQGSQYHNIFINYCIFKIQVKQG